MGVETENLNFEEAEIGSDDDIPEESHKSLLDAVSQLYKKQRIEAPKRREAAQEISEFNLSSKAEKNNDLVSVNDLLKDLEKKVTHKEIARKVKIGVKKSKTLPKPLEENKAKEIRRSLGYEEVKHKLNKWDSIVKRNRLATQLVFPLEQKPLVKEAPNFLTTFQKPSELELAMAAVLNQSEIAKEEREKEDNLAQLSYEQMLERRNMVLKMRARESYQIAKNTRQNKIKSKKYHRILKKERIKQQIKDFEKLKETDPEAALEKLEQIERARAEERISLRHRNTGKWAKNQAIRAKYDTEARVALAEQLAKSRELTRKTKANESSDSEDQENDLEATLPQNSNRLNPQKTNSANPWINDVQEFVKGFEKFSSEKTNVPELQDGEGNKNSGQKDDAEVLSNENNEAQQEKNSNEVVEDNSCASSVKSSSKKEEAVDKNRSDPKTTEEGSSVSLIEKNIISKSPASEAKKPKSQSKSPSKQDKRPRATDFFTEEVTDVENIPDQNPEENSDSNKVTEEESTTSAKPKRKRNRRRKRASNNEESKDSQSPKITHTTSGSFIELDTGETPTKKAKKSKDKSLNDIFDDAEEVLKNSLSKVSKVVSKLDQTPDETDKVKRKRKHNETERPTRKKDLTQGDIDEALLEIHEEGISSGVNDLHSIKNKMQATVETEKQEEPQIDPNKHMTVKPQKLLSEVGEMEEDGDSSEDEGGRQKMHLMEAFADDDIADQFNKDKNEEAEKNKSQEINLGLPGWGSWGGTNISAKTKRRRKMTFKLPAVPRKDANRPHVIINEDPVPKLRQLLVNELPYPFTSVKDFEASIRAPLGRQWVPEKAHKKITAPPVVTKMGTIIEPIAEEKIVLKSNLKKNEGKVKKGKPQNKSKIGKPQMKDKKDTKKDKKGNFQNKKKVPKAS